MALIFDDGFASTVDGVEELLSEVVEDDDTPCKLLYFFAPSETMKLEQAYFMVGFVLQSSKLLGDLQNSSSTRPPSPELVAARRRLCCACALQPQLGADSPAKGCQSFAAAFGTVWPEPGRRAAKIASRKAAAVADRLDNERNQRLAITLGATRLAARYSEGITFVLSADLVTSATELAGRLDAFVQGFWMHAGSQQDLLARSDCRRQRYKQAVGDTAARLLPLLPAA